MTQGTRNKGKSPKKRVGKASNRDEEKRARQKRKRETKQSVQLPLKQPQETCFTKGNNLETSNTYTVQSTHGTVTNTLTHTPIPFLAPTRKGILVAVPTLLSLITQHSHSTQHTGAKYMCMSTDRTGQAVFPSQQQERRKDFKRIAHH